MKPYTVEDLDGIEYIADNLLEAGIFAFITGAPGVTKTLITLEIAARLTRGLMPGDVNTPVNVLYISVESRFRRSVGARFLAAEGDPLRFEHIDKVIWLPSKIAELEALIIKYRAKLVILDPIKNYFDPKVYASPTKTSEALQLLNDLAEKHGCTILGVDWPSKSSKKGDLSVGGNAAMTGKPRQVLTVGRLSLDEWVIGVSKANDSAEWIGWIYGTDVVDLGPGRNGKNVTAMKVRWLRSALPAQVKNSREQAKLEEDPNLIALLQFMTPGQSFRSDTLLDWLKAVLLVGKNKGYSLLNSAKAAGYLHQMQGVDEHEKYEVRWSITPLGTMKLAPDEESVEQAISTVFPSMSPPDPNIPALNQGD